MNRLAWHVAVLGALVLPTVSSAQETDPSLAEATVFVEEGLGRREMLALTSIELAEYANATLDAAAAAPDNSIEQKHQRLRANALFEGAETLENLALAGRSLSLTGDELDDIWSETETFFDQALLDRLGDAVVDSFEATMSAGQGLVHYGELKAFEYEQECVDPMEAADLPADDKYVVACSIGLMRLFEIILAAG